MVIITTWLQLYLHLLCFKVKCTHTHIDFTSNDLSQGQCLYVSVCWSPLKSREFQSGTFSKKHTLTLDIIVCVCSVSVLTYETYETYWTFFYTKNWHLSGLAHFFHWRHGIYMCYEINTKVAVATRRKTIVYLRGIQFLKPIISRLGIPFVLSMRKTEQESFSIDVSIIRSIYGEAECWILIKNHSTQKVIFLDHILRAIFCDVNPICQLRLLGLVRPQKNVDLFHVKNFF